MRFPLVARIGSIAVLSITIAWIGFVALIYLTTSDPIHRERPLPGQVANLVSLLEQASPSERDLILRAVKSQTLTAHLETGSHVGTMPKLQRVPRIAARAIDHYLAALGGRASSVNVRDDAGNTGGLKFTFAAPVELEIRVQLLTGETLVVNALSYPIVNLFGIPVGFLAGLTGAVLGLIALIALQREAALNRLQVRLGQLARARIVMIGGISHDVRTFLTRLRLRVDGISEEQERVRAIADIADMIHLLDDALLASRAGEGELNLTLVEFAPLVEEEVNDWRSLGKPVELKLADTAPNTTVLGDRLALRRVIANLIDNALSYGKLAAVSIGNDGERVVLTVDDKGPGIPVELREVILEPFVRLDDSRSRRTGGAGLGLAVARSLVDAHHGDMSISDAPQGGARLVVRIPVFRAD
jgi:signal transduction histidine kinase